jgi:molybdopterin/thiamine biosynthesis adenylyltransferase
VFQKLVSHNPDLQKLVERGYAVAFDSNHLIVRDIPYLGPVGSLKTGAIVTKLEFIDLERVKQFDHQIFFAGSVPHSVDGTPIANLGGGPVSVSLGAGAEDISIERSFSNKRKVAGALVDFDDFFQKIQHYVSLISGPAMELHDVDPYTFRAVENVVPDSVFKFHDTLTSRAEIGDLTSRLEDDVIAVIGLGGTGSYVLDFLIKSRVKEIKGFDADKFHVHNAYRIPGKTEESEFDKSKAEVLQQRYDNFRTGLSLEHKFIDETCSEDFEGVTFAFVCVDKGSSRSAIIQLLISLHIPFIDVGMGLSRKSGPLSGMARVVYFPTDQAEDIRDKGLVELADVEANIYRTNIQISELNAINACMAVIKFKQIRGFYLEKNPSYHLLFNLGEMKLYGE